MADMIYRRFGRTALQMPVLTTGGMRYQDGWKDKSIDEIADENQRNLEACIHRSLEVGINHIETARGYGPSERQLGQILPGLPSWESTPGQLNLENILWLRNVARGWDMLDYAKARSNLMGNGGPWQPGAKVDQAFDEVDKQALVAALDGHPVQDQVVDLIRDAIDLLAADEVKRASQGG